MFEIVAIIVAIATGDVVAVGHQRHDPFPTTQACQKYMASPEAKAINQKLADNVSNSSKASGLPLKVKFECKAIEEKTEKQ